MSMRSTRMRLGVSARKLASRSSRTSSSTHCAKTPNDPLTPARTWAGSSQWRPHFCVDTATPNAERLRDWQPPTRSTSRAIPRVTDPLLAETDEDGGTVNDGPRDGRGRRTRTPGTRLALPHCLGGLLLVARRRSRPVSRKAKSGPRLNAIRKEIRRRVAANEQPESPTPPRARLPRLGRREMGQPREPGADRRGCSPRGRNDAAHRPAAPP